jgi:hypothetical protein
MNIVRVWNRFFFGPISARPLGAFRIVFSLLVLANLAILSVDMDYWLTDQGVLKGNEAKELAGPLRWSLLQTYQDPQTVHAVFAATAVLAVVVAVGWHTRVASALLYFALMSIHHRNLSAVCGADSLLVILAFSLMLSPSGAAYSIDAWLKARKRGTSAEPLIIPWAQRLIQIQLTVVYVATAMLKCNGSTWFDGTAIHYIILNVEIGRFWLASLSEYPLIINALTHGALLTEVVLPLFLWYRPTRRWAILLGIALHIGIHLTVNIPIFGELMLVCYLTFLTPDELDALLRSFNPRTWFARRPKATIRGRVDRASSDWQGPHTPVDNEDELELELVGAHEASGDR